MWSLFRRRRRDTGLRVTSRSEHLFGAKPDSIDISAFAPELAALVASSAYQHYSAYRLLSRWVSAADGSGSRYDFASIATAEYKTFSKLRKALGVISPGSDPRELCTNADAIDAAYGGLVPRTWQEAAMHVYVVGGLLDGAHLALFSAIGAVPEAAIDRLVDRRGAEKSQALLAGQIESGEFPRDDLALWGRAVVGDALLAVRSSLLLPDAVVDGLTGVASPDDATALAIAHVDAFQSQLVAEHTLRMDALHLTA